jgi:NAD(P)-dependent dehydrogenase (short-subunit alcohol dehydrogenase family)
MLSLDVRTDDSVRACVEAVVNRRDRLDVLINNAGYELAGALEELSSEEARAQFETNFFGVVRMVNAVLPLMRQQRRGHIINVSSLTGLTAIPFLGIYSASKCALEGYTEAYGRKSGLSVFTCH